MAVMLNPEIVMPNLFRHLALIQGRLVSASSKILKQVQGDDSIICKFVIWHCSTPLLRGS